MAQDRQGSAESGVDITVGVGRDSTGGAGAYPSATAGGLTYDELPQLDDVFAVIEAELHIDTHDHAVANFIADGFRYFVRKELAVELPMVMRFYDIEFEFLGRRSGSVHDKHRIKLKLNRDGRDLKRRVAELEKEIRAGKKPSAAALTIITFLTAVLGLGQAGLGVWEKRVEAQTKALERTEQRLKNDQPVRIELEFHIRPADASDAPPTTGQSFDL